MRYIYLIAIAALTFVSCEELFVTELELEDFGYERQLAISGTLTSGSENFTMLVSENSPITANFDQINFLDNAEVSIFKGDELIGKPTYSSETNLYELDLTGQSLTGGEYNLEVSHPDFPVATSSTNIPADLDIKKVELIPEAGISPSFLVKSDAIEITFQDPPGDQFYRFSVGLDEVVMDTFINGVDTFIYEVFADFQVDSAEPGVQANYDNLLLEDTFFDGKEHTFRVFVSSWEFETLIDFKDNLLVTWEVLSPDKYNFETSLTNYYNSQGFGPFSEAVTLYNNIENGQGIFAGVSRYELKVE